ncbi:MAG: hypothetical protein IT385_11750 [Deltaproteobacteria bacterium]|nr:hypothetical protein [Deltaproteobacteria bacterium]
MVPTRALMRLKITDPPAESIAALVLVATLAACGRGEAPADVGSANAPAAVGATPEPEPARVPRFLRAAGHRFCLVEAGVPRCWGDNPFGVIGSGGEACGDDERCLTRPTIVEAFGVVHDLALAKSHTCIQRDGGEVLCLGSEVDGALGLGTHPAATSPTPIAGAPRATSLWVGSAATCVVTDEGALRCAGGGSLGRLAALPETCGRYAAPCSRALVVVRDRGVAEVAFGYQSACVLGADGSVACGGPLEGAFAEIDDGVELVMGGLHACVRHAGGVVDCAGWNARGQLGRGALDEPQLQRVGAPRVIDRARGLAAGDHHTCAIVEDGALWCWGDNVFGQCGGPPSDVVTRPRRVSDLPPVVQVVANDAATCALDHDGRVWCFGSDAQRQLGGSEVSGTCDTGGIDARTVSCRGRPAIVPM